MMKIKSKQKLRIMRYVSGQRDMTVCCTYGNLPATLDSFTVGAVQDALDTIVQDSFQYKGISATFRGLNLQVDLID